MKQRKLTSILLSNLFFTVLQPGIVAGLIPYYIVRDEINLLFKEPLGAAFYLGFSIVLIGIAITIICILNFALKGRGTLSPVDPTKKLVVSGPYKYSRNPMYVGVMCMLLGEALIFNNTTLWIYGAAIFVMFNIFIRVIEEPRLKRDFDDEYIEYRKSVRRWI